jgi:hypothetical protein
MMLSYNRQTQTMQLVFRHREQKVMRIKAMLITHHLPEESVPWMAGVRDTFDGLVVFIDENRVTPGTVMRAEQVATRVYHYKAETWYDWDLAGMARACESDWVFIIDYDEQLSPEWRQDSWRELLKETHFTHFSCPRRWIVPSGDYITAAPWWPDFQLRLFRNNLKETAFPQNLHDLIQVPGPGASFQNLAIHHHVLSLLSRPTREQKVRHYEKLRPGEALSHYYLYEDYSPPTASLPPPAKLDAATEVGSMETLEPEKVSDISIEINRVPQAVRISEFFWLEAKVINATDKPLSALPPFPLRLAYHWIDKVTGRMVVFDGERSGLFPGVPANASREYRMSIVAPNQPGKYVLQTTVVQDGVRWLDQVEPKILHEFDLTVIATANNPRPVSTVTV